MLKTSFMWLEIDLPRCVCSVCQHLYHNSVVIRRINAPLTKSEVFADRIERCIIISSSGMFG